MLRLGLVALLASLSLSQGFLLDTLFGKGGFARFVLYTRDNSRNLQGDTIRSVHDLRRSNFDHKRPTKFFIHGWFGAGTHWYIDEMRKSMLKQEDCNFIHVDWWKGSVKPSYPKAMKNAKIVASEVYDFIKFLEKETGHKPPQIHLIGHSLGAQVSGEVGRRFQSPEKISRISGLDPAQPGYNVTDYKTSLDKSDADFVDIIHTSPVATVPMGHVDFYPNGGYTGKFPVLGLVQSHLEVTYLYTASIRGNCKFTAHKCSDYATYKSGSCKDCGDGSLCNIMGYFASPKKALGNLFLTVTNNKPYCDIEP